jgi:hypothetical protein
MTWGWTNQQTSLDRLAEWILARGGEPFFLLEAQWGMQRHGEASSGVSKEVSTFERHGMVTPMPDGRRVYYVVRPSPYWDAFTAISVALGLVRTHPDSEAAATAERTDGSRG